MFIVLGYLGTDVDLGKTPPCVTFLDACLSGHLDQGLLIPRTRVLNEHCLYGGKLSLLSCALREAYRPARRCRLPRRSEYDAALFEFTGDSNSR